MPGTSVVAGNTVLHLAPRESQLLSLLADGLGHKEVAAIMCISYGTSKEYTAGVKRKLEILGYKPGTTAGMVALALRNGWIK
jgi:DNA-binding NarL/FixJ family response regulator